MSTHANARQSHNQKSRMLLARSGYGSGGSVKSQTINPTPAAPIPPGVAKQIKDGGAPGGAMPKRRLDKHARGGKVKAGSTTTNVIIAMPPDNDGPATPMPLPPGPPPGPPGAGAAGPIAPPMMPPSPAGLPMRKRGGKVPPSKIKGPKTIPMDAGAGGGEGRLDKIANQRKVARG